MTRSAQAAFIAFSLVLSAWCVATCGIVPMAIHVSRNQPPCHKPAQKECPNPCESKLKGVFLKFDAALLPQAAPVAEFSPLAPAFQPSVLESAPLPTLRSTTVLRI